MNDLAFDEWLNKAACRGNVTELLWISDNQQDQKEAKSFCNTVCPVKNDCLEYAIRANEETGVWGGMSPSDRRKLKRTRLDTRAF